MSLVPAEDYRPSPPSAKRVDAKAPTRLAATAANDQQSSISTLSGLSCALSIAKVNYGVMHGIRRSMII
jgi:hypothetical protein